MKNNKEEQSGRKSEVRITSQPSTGLRHVDSLAPAHSALRASASGEFLSSHPKQLKSPAPTSEGNIRKLQYWESLTAGERKLICCLMRMLRGAKRSQSLDVAGAATKWERGIGCFIKVRLMGACRAGQLSKA